MKYSFFLNLFSFLAIGLTSSLVAAQCTDGRIPCTHKCETSQRPSCTDSKGAGGKAYCTTAQFCRDKSQVACESGWSSSTSKCSASDRANRGCQDKRANSGNGYCVRFTR